MSERGTYRDRITWKQDNAAAGASDPSYGATLASDVPCRIRPLTGQETFRGRQLQGQVDYVVEMAYYTSIGGSLVVSDRGTVTAGLYNGKNLHVAWINTLPMERGRPPISEVYCREEN